MLFGAAIAAATIYMAGLFWLAAWRDRSTGNPLQRYSGWIYGLSLSVYCTSWTFFGGVGTAATAGLEYVPIYLGPILLFSLGYGLVRRILAQTAAQHSTSIADFLSARYGKSAGVAALVTIIATIGSLPYMALQLQSVGNALLTIDPEIARAVALDEVVLLTAGLMALFAILFGARRADRAGDNAGLVLTIALESVVKLIALLAIAGLALWLLLTGGEGSPAHASMTATSPFSLDQLGARFWILSLLGACATLCLPRQFHMTFIEAPAERPSPAMQWVFPVYLLITSLVIIPIAWVGPSVLPASTNPDTIVLALPLATGHEGLALLMWIGGFSAATGMIAVASVALSTMITNDLIAPLAFRRALTGEAQRGQIAERLVMIRRIVIAALLFFAYIFYLGFGTARDLAGLGTLAFAAVAQFAPGLVLGVLSRKGTRQGMTAGLIVGFVLWFVLLIIPGAQGGAPIFAIHPDPLVSGVLISLFANIACYWFVSSISQPTILDEAQAAAFVGAPSPGNTASTSTRKRVADIRLLLEQFIGKPRADAEIAAMPTHYRDGETADDALVSMAERTIAGVVGSSSARMLVASWVGGEPVPLPEVMAMFDETNRRLTFSGDLLQIAIENIDQGVALIDAEMKLVAWNSRYIELFGLPESMVQIGTPIAQLIRHNLKQGGLDDDEIEAQVARRLSHMIAGREHRMEREQHDGRIMRIIGNPAPGGGYVTSYTDVTADRRAEQALEEKVAERTAQLSAANAALEKATRSKTHFLAAASHDLIQPLNAARLFASALGEELRGNEELLRLIRDLDGSIASADRLIRALLDISKLDGGGIRPKIEPLALDEVFDEIMREFAVQAGAKGIRLRRVHTSVWIESDRALLASVLRNLMSNAIRYTEKGGVLLGVRRAGEDIRLSIYDTGPGIANDDVERLFGEFQRGYSVQDRDGLGLGLAIVRRITALFGLIIETRSELGRGSEFSLTIPVMRRAEREQPRRRSNRSKLTGAKILVVDNDPSALSATAALLKKWGLDVVVAMGADEAFKLCPEAPDTAIMDFRLDGAERGDSAYEALCTMWGERPPAILLTAETGEETEAAAQRMGANRLLKPPSPASLRALISDCLARRDGNDHGDELPLA